MQENNTSSILQSQLDYLTDWINYSHKCDSYEQKQLGQKWEELAAKCVVLMNSDCDTDTVFGFCREIYSVYLEQVWSSP